MPYTATGPPESSRTTGSASALGRVRRCTPALSSSRLPNPSRRAESWLPLISTILAPVACSLSRASSHSSTASTGGTARS